MKKVQLTVAAFALGMFSLAPAFADDMGTPVTTDAAAQVCQMADKSCDATITVADDCTAKGGTLVDAATCAAPAAPAEAPAQ